MKNGRLHGGGDEMIKKESGESSGGNQTPKNARKLKGFFSGESNDTSQTTSYYKTTTMNSNSPVENVATVANVATKAPKKPTLSAKYSRFLSFGHWFLTQTDLNEETRKQLFQQMTMFGTVEEQTTYFEGFFGAIKETNKVMRKMVAEAKKPPKAPKAPRAKKTKAAPAAQDELVAQLIADANGGEPVAAAPTGAAAPKEKKPRAKKVKEVAAADATEPAAPAADATVAPKEKKPRAKKVKETEPVAASVATDAAATEPIATEAAPAPAAATEAAAPKEKKPRAKKADAAEKPKKTKKSEAAPAAPVDEATEDVQTRVVTIGDKEYLIDAENNLYDTNFPHDQVGTFNPETGAIQA